jgi:transcriptional regulator of aromatic amino acid metabolism
MAKEVALEIEIDENGKIHVAPTGTQGAECLELMAFMDKIEGFTTVETVKNADFKTKKVQINSIQKVG